MRITAACIALAAALPAAGALAGQTIKWDQAERHVGDEVTVDGRVLGVHCSPSSCVLGFDPAFKRFTAVVEARSFDTFPPRDIDRLYNGRRVRVHGKIEKRDGKPEIVVEMPDDLTLVHAERGPQRDGDRSLRTQTEILERLADVLARIEDLTERLGATQERMETLLAQMEQQGAALAAAQASQQAGPPAPLPTDGEPQPRPAYERLRTVKRGMSRSEVQRLIGQPQYVEGGGGGWSTWYYGYGRSVSFDGRGRAQSLVGFPAP